MTLRLLIQDLVSELGNRSELLNRWKSLDQVIHLNKDISDFEDAQLEHALQWCRRSCAQIYEGDFVIGELDPLRPYLNARTEISHRITQGIRVTLTSAIPILHKEVLARDECNRTATDSPQLPLLGAIESPTISATTIDERFRLFHAANPHVYEALRTLAFRVKAKGHDVYGIGGLFEVLRWEYAMQTSTDPFKLSNDFRALYSRLLMEQEPRLNGMFRLRRRTTTGAAEKMTNQQPTSRKGPHGKKEEDAEE